MQSRRHELIVSAATEREGPHIAVLGKDIRSRPEEIARYCLESHRAINEDVATIAESVALADRLFARQRGMGWARQITIEIPVFEVNTFQRVEVVGALVDAAHFLTGDMWNFHFVQRPGSPRSAAILPFEKVKHRYVMAHSDGLDSYAQAQLLEAEVGGGEIFKIRSSRIGQDGRELQKGVLRVPRYLGPKRKPEQTYRSRPFVFFAFAGIGAYVSDARAVVVGETGQGAIGPALVRYAGEWPFRSTHPGFVGRMATYLSLVFEQAITFELRQLWRTKGEVLRELAEKELLGQWEGTRSCSVRPTGLHGARNCGICGGCMLRSLACHAAGLADMTASAAFDLRAIAPVALDGRLMSDSERQIAVRSIGSLVELARIRSTAIGQGLVRAESGLFPSQPAERVEQQLNDLLDRHAAEWRAFCQSLPVGGWARDFAEHL